MPSAWITHVKNYASKNNINYSAALKDPKCSQSYKMKVGSGNTFRRAIGRNRVAPNNIQPNQIAPEPDLDIELEPPLGEAALENPNLEPEPEYIDINFDIPEPNIPEPNIPIADPIIYYRLNETPENIESINIIEDLRDIRKNYNILLNSLPTNYSTQDFNQLLNYYENFIDLYDTLHILMGLEVPINNRNIVDFLINNEDVNILSNLNTEGAGLKGLDKNKEIDILKYSNPNKAWDNAIKYLKKNIVMGLSTKKTKKYMVQRPDGKWIHFGEIGFEDFTKHKDNKRRLAYLKRTENMKGNWKDDKFSANNLARNILWK